MVHEQGEEEKGEEDHDGDLPPHHPLRHQKRPNQSRGPRIKPMLARFDPRTFPTAMSAFPRSVARIATINSGAEVPRETTVSPMTMGLRPRLPWSRAAPRTIQSAPK